MSSDDSKSSGGRVAIIVAIIGLVGTLLTVVINNWKNIFPPSPPTVITAPGGDTSKAVVATSIQTLGKPKPVKTIASSNQVPELRHPTLLTPENNAVFDLYPRHTTLTWNAVKNATSYKVELQYGGGVGWSDYPPVTTKATDYNFDFIGAQPGRWRVSSVYSDGQISSPSEWRMFKYLK